jgi:hypothetical protein
MTNTAPKVTPINAVGTPERYRFAVWFGTMISARVDAAPFTRTY